MRKWLSIVLALLLCAAPFVQAEENRAVLDYQPLKEL